MPEWFEEWFGEEYLALYPHRNASEAARAIDLLADRLPWRPGWRVLDIASGPGRHAAAVEASGGRPVGIDLSRHLLQVAREHTSAPLVRADMRQLPVRPGTMDLVLNLFTSFGYFETDEQHSASLAEMVATVRPEGWFVLDFLNSDTVRANLIPEEELTLNGEPVKIRRHTGDDGLHVVKEIHTADGRRFVERVRLYSPEDLERLLNPLVSVEHRFGDYHGGPLVPGAPRAMLVGRRR